MADDLLRSRIAFVESNLKQIGNLMEVVKARKNHLAATQTFLSENAERLRETSATLTIAENEFRGQADYARSSTFRRMATDLSSISDHMLAFRQQLERSQSLLARISQLGAQGGAQNDFTGVDIEKEAVEDIKRNLIEIRGKLDAQGSTGGPGPAWQQFHDHVRTQAQDLFCEYVDLLGGLAVRDVGLDRDACRLADDLFRFYALGPRELPLTIPSRYRANSRGWGRVMRLGFPEWTVWTLPLVAQDFWFAVGRNRFQAEVKLAGVGDDLPMQDCLADAFGTLALGPAYAYAAIRLRFDPFTAYEALPSSATDDNRVHAVLTMLNNMSPSGERNDFTQISEQLEKQWTEALSHANPRGKADVEFKRRISEAVEALAPKMRATADGQTGLTIEAWNQFQTWPTFLMEGREKEIAPAGADLRWVLNAAWIARVQSREEDLAELTTRAEALWNKVVDDVTIAGQRGPKLPPRR